MIVSTPYTECYVKKSFLAGAPKYDSDETIFGVLYGIRFVRGRAPLYLIYFPSLGAFFDKVDQCAIFNKPNTPNYKIKMADVGWWDCLSDYWQLTQIQGIKGMDVEMYSRTNHTWEGTYLWTCDPQSPKETTDYGQAECWHEHKTKTYFFDDETGVLCCGPNNKMRFLDNSLCGKELEKPYWLKVYKDSDSPERTSHECDNISFGDTDNWDYSE
tara:strand:- start:5526 stop:6167 length:642 start_codon:yes stop_codon:yes gene_type:complete